MYLDISSYNGDINWRTVADSAEVDGVILRSTTSGGNLDVRAIQNYNGILQNLPDVDELSFYKFTYANAYVAARLECRTTLTKLKAAGLHFDYLYLDIEGHGGKDYTTMQANEVILGYLDEMKLWNVDNLLRLYFNYNYLKNIIDPVWRSMPIWLARYNDSMGDIFGANVKLWQYTSNGKIAGITGNVDVSRVV